MSRRTERRGRAAVLTLDQRSFVVARLATVEGQHEKGAERQEQQIDGERRSPFHRYWSVQSCTSMTSTTGFLPVQSVATRRTLSRIASRPNGATVNAFSNAPITVGAKPGACILYQITATNVGTQPVNNVIISDATPANTTYNTGSVCPITTGTAVAASTIVGAVVTPPATVCAAGTVSVAIPTMAPGATGVVSFGVRINP